MPIFMTIGSDMNYKKDKKMLEQVQDAGLRNQRYEKLRPIQSAGTGPQSSLVKSGNLVHHSASLNSSPLIHKSNVP